MVELLKLESGQSLRVEGIEDIDVWGEVPSVVQVKYYEGQRWSLSSIRNAVHELLKSFASGLTVKYILYVHFGSGNLPPESLSLDELKECLTYRPRQKPAQLLYKEFEEKQLSDFIEHFQICPGASLREQRQITTSAIAAALSCSEEEAEHLHRMRAVQFLHEVAVRKAEEERTITRDDLLKRIGDREIIYSRWHKEIVGQESFLNATVRKLKSAHFNVSNTYRGVYLEVNRSNIASVQRLACELAQDMLGTTRRRTTAAKPWTLILRGEDSLIADVKKSLIQDALPFNDGFESLQFSPALFTEPVVVKSVGATDRLSKASHVIRVISERSMRKVAESTDYQLAQLITLEAPETWQSSLTRAEPVQINEVSVDEITKVLRKVMT